MKQWVCKTCSDNMVGAQVDICPFCGATHDQFISWEQAEKTYQVCSYPITNRVTQLISDPKLGLEHAAYRVEIKQGTLQGAQHFHGIISKHPLTTVCAYNYICDFKSWMTYLKTFG